MPKQRASNAIHSGTVAMSIPATEELIQRSPTLMAVNGTAISITAKANTARLCCSSARKAPRRQAIGSRIAAPMVVRHQAIIAGSSSTSASLMKKYGRPQMMPSAANADQARQFKVVGSRQSRRRLHPQC